MQPHTSREIAQAMVDRVWPRYPQPVALAAEECQSCGGDGTVLVSPSSYPEDPRAVPVRCEECAGSGSVVPQCMCCRSEATTALSVEAPSPLVLCDHCAMDTACLDVLDLAVAIALRVLP